MDGALQCTFNQPSTFAFRYKLQFLIYAHYVTFLHESRRQIDILSKKNEQFRNTLTQINQRRKNRLEFGDYMAVSFQRILKYPLLLKRLKNATHEHDKDFVPIR